MTKRVPVGFDPRDAPMIWIQLNLSFLRLGLTRYRIPSETLKNKNRPGACYSDFACYSFWPEFGQQMRFHATDATYENSSNSSIILCLCLD